MVTALRTDGKGPERIYATFQVLALGRIKGCAKDIALWKRATDLFADT